MAWPVAAVAGRGCQLSAPSHMGYRAVGNNKTCSRRLVALPNTQADGGLILCAAVDGAGQEEAST